MVSKESIEKQLKRLNFKVFGWGSGEVSELHNIILPDEEIYECVNGIYEGGFALLLATDTRVLLVDKKPLSFLAVEDLRFDMINEIDYNHRILGAYITVATGNKTLRFRSYNKDRLRKLIGHVQHCMSETKKLQTTHQEGQNQHLEQINQQLQVYLMAQYKQQQELHEQLEKVQQVGSTTALASRPEPIQPSPELADYLYAHGLLQEYQQQTGKVLYPSSSAAPISQLAPGQTTVAPQVSTSGNSGTPGTQSQLAEIYADGMQEVFGKRGSDKPQVSTVSDSDQTSEINPLRIACSKLPMAWRSRKFGLGRPSLRPALRR